MLRFIFVLLLVVLVVIQFFRPAKNTSAVAGPDDITAHFPVPDSVQTVLKRSCYDCHSNNTHYPWYYNIQPVAWWMKNHIDDGKREVDFSTFASYPAKRQYHKLKDVSEQLQRDEMPLNSYLWIHHDAKLSASEKTLVMRWADSLSAGIKAANHLVDEPRREFH